MAQLTMLKGKIHRCTVTQADLDYEGSVTISEDLMEAASIVEHEQVHIWDVTSGARITTYAMRGARSSGTICINGAAAHLIKPGDLVIIAAFLAVDEAYVDNWNPSIVLVNAHVPRRKGAAFRSRRARVVILMMQCRDDDLPFGGSQSTYSSTVRSTLARYRRITSPPLFVLYLLD